MDGPASRIYSLLILAICQSRVSVARHRKRRPLCTRRSPGGSDILRNANRCQADVVFTCRFGERDTGTQLVFPIGRPPGGVKRGRRGETGAQLIYFTRQFSSVPHSNWDAHRTPRTPRAFPLAAPPNPTTSTPRPSTASNAIELPSQDATITPLRSKWLSQNPTLLSSLSWPFIKQQTLPNTAPLLPQIAPKSSPNSPFPHEPTPPRNTKTRHSHAPHAPAPRFTRTLPSRKTRPTQIRMNENLAPHQLHPFPRPTIKRSKEDGQPRAHTLANYYLAISPPPFPAQKSTLPTPRTHLGNLLFGNLPPNFPNAYYSYRSRGKTAIDTHTLAVWYLADSPHPH